MRNRISINLVSNFLLTNYLITKEKKWELYSGETGQLLTQVIKLTSPIIGNGTFWESGCDPGRTYHS